MLVCEIFELYEICCVVMGCVFFLYNCEGDDKVCECLFLVDFEE